MSVRIVRVAMIKAESAWGKLRANIELLEQLARSLCGQRLDVLITPECFLDGYMVREKQACTRRRLLARCVTGHDDPLIRRAARLAKTLGVYIVIGASEKDGRGVIRNAAYLLDRQGGHVGTYYKVQPVKMYERGTDLPVFQTDFGKVGIIICADRRWPENIRCLKLKGAELILNPTWGFYNDLNTAIMRTRAYENSIPICFTHPCQSLVCLQDGSVGAILESAVPDVLITELDLAKNVSPGQTGAPAEDSPIQNRCPDMYGALVS